MSFRGEINEQIRTRPLLAIAAQTPSTAYPESCSCQPIALKDDGVVMVAWVPSREGDGLS